MRYEHVQVSEDGTEKRVRCVRHGGAFKRHSSQNGGEVSPIKASRKNPDVKYFSGKITDGKKVARVISFDPKLRSILEKSREENTSLALVNCNVRKGKFDSGMEVMANNYTKVQNSPKRFKVDDVGNLLDASCSAVYVSLDQIGSLAVNQHLSSLCSAVSTSLISLCLCLCLSNLTSLSSSVSIAFVSPA